MNSSQKFQSISWKFLAILVPAIVLLAAITTAAYTYIKVKSSEKNLTSKIETIFQVHSLAVAHPLWSLDFDGLHRGMSTIALHPEIMCVAINEANLTEYYQWPEGCISSTNNQKMFFGGLFLDSDSIGTMKLYYTNLPQREALKRELYIAALFSLLLAGFAGLVAYLTLQYIVGKPIKRLNASIKQSEQNNQLQTVSWPAQDELGNVISAYNRMIHQIDQNTQEIVTARQEAEAATYTKSRFLANMSHELRTPLNAVIGITEMLREEAEDDRKDTEPYDRVALSGRHLLHLIDDILDFSKIEAGKVSISIEDVNIANLLEEVCDTIRPITASSNNELALNFTGEPAYMKTDPLRLKQILINLLSNAYKFTHKGKIELEVGSNNEQSVVHFAVHDNGIGISEDQRQRLFSDFSQADISTTRQYGGTGLGLAISQRLCELLGGTISVESTVEVGSTFSFTLLTEPTSNTQTDSPN